MRPVLPISVRTFLLVLMPMSLALVAGFVLLLRGTESGVRDGLRSTLAQAQHNHLRDWEETRSRQQRLLIAVAEHSALKPGLGLWAAAGHSDEARATIADQLAELGASLGYELVAVQDASFAPVAAQLARKGGSRGPVAIGAGGLRNGLARVEGNYYEVLAVPVNNDRENLGWLAVGQRLDLRSSYGEAVLIQNGRVVLSSVKGPGIPEIQEALDGCGADRECDLRLNGEAFLALRPVQTHLGDEFAVVTFHSVDSASQQILASARWAFRVSLLATLLGAVLVALWTTRSLIRPLTDFVDRLKDSGQSGLLRADFPMNSTTREINHLAQAFNTAALAIADSHRRLDQAYLELTKTMAQALDARDPYTAGHSSRVSDYAVAIARELSLPEAEVEIVRIGANLHDIGKIGISDSVLQKPGRLTDAELAIIKEHPVIGRRILEGVARFRAYLDIVELHHENHDGSGYPYGISGDTIPLGARIVHVVDAYDAMTTDRPYRKAMEPEEAEQVLRRHSGTMFDPRIVELFIIVRRSMPALAAIGAARDLAALSREVSHPDHETVSSQN